MAFASSYRHLVKLRVPKMKPDIAKFKIQKFGVLITRKSLSHAIPQW
jgi:hypothetical protein